MKQRLKTAILLGPGLGWLALLMVVPCALIFTYSVFERGVYGGIDYTFTLENFRRAADPLFLGIFLQSAKIAGLATLIAILIAYPAAFAITRAPRRWQTALLILVILPFWSNYLIRTYAWIVMLNREGLINNGLAAIGVIEEPLPLLYNTFAVVVGLVYNYTPFVVLAIYASLNRINRETIEASEDLGAPGWVTFRRVIVPQTVPGIAAGGVFVFVLSIGNFITPDLLGGGRLQMVGNLIYDQFLSARDWPFGATLSMFLIALMMILLFAQAMVARRAAREAAR
ncbi:MAG: ABC transporter permease [Pseudomonadota bacterium]